MYCETSRRDRIQNYIDSLAVNVAGARALPRTPRVPTEDPAARTLATPVYSWYQRANRLYQQRIGDNQRYIRLNDARRTTAEQGRLKRGAIATDEYGIGNYLPANLPGASLHEYGYAIDVDLLSSTVDAAQVIRALHEVGFDDPVASEPHHFEATGAKGHAAVLAAIVKIKGPGTLTYQYGENLVWLFERCQQKQLLLTACTELVRQNQAIVDELRAKESDVARLTQEAQIASNEYSRVHADYTRALNLYESARASAESFPQIWHCRAGATIQQCTNPDHEPDRQFYWSELRRLQADAYARGIEANRLHQIALNAYRVHTRAQQALSTVQQELLDLKNKHRLVLVPIYQNDRRIKQAEDAIDVFRTKLLDLEVQIAKYVRQNIP